MAKMKEVFPVREFSVSQGKLDQKKIITFCGAILKRVISRQRSVEDQFHNEKNMFVISQVNITLKYI